MTTMDLPMTTFEGRGTGRRGGGGGRARDRGGQRLGWFVALPHHGLPPVTRPTPRLPSMVRRALADCPPAAAAPRTLASIGDCAPRRRPPAARRKGDAGRLDEVTRIYLDHNATTPVAPPVADAITRALRDVFGNPSSVHAYGQEAKTALDEARSAVARLIGAEPTEIVFTSGGSESNNLAVRGVAEAAAGGGRRRLVASGIEHEAVLRTLKALDGHGRSTALVGVDERGVVSPDRLAEALSDDTALVSVMHANNEIGHDSARRRDRRAGPRARGPRAHRRRPVGGQGPGRRARPRRRPAVAVRATSSTARRGPGPSGSAGAPGCTRN